MGKRKVFGSYDPAQDGPAQTGPSVSDTLRETRESLGYDLREVATMLRIRYPYLQAIEAGRFEDLPGTTYAAGFLRSYAECLGLDPDTILTRYKDEAAGRTRSQQLYFPTPVPEGRIPGGTVLLGTMVLAGIVYGGWYYLSATDRSMVDLVPTLPDRLVSLLDTLPFNANQTGGQSAAVPAPAETPAAPASVPTVMAEAPSTPAVPPVAAPPAAGGASTAVPAPSATPVPAAPAPAAPAPTVQAPATMAPAKPTPAPAAVVAQPAPAAPAKPTAPTAAPAPAAAPSAMVNVPPPPAEDDESEGAAQEPTPLTPAAPVIASLPPVAPAAPPPAADGALPSKVYGTQNAASRIQLRATQDSWIQVRDNSGEIIFTRVLKPGDVYRVPDRSGIRVRTGNAGGLVVVTDGVDGAPMGAVGQVLRDVSLDQHAPTLRGAAPAH
ncbi:helix-turn-helix domain-containing protein (plasmid) [Azospirillum argentinense]|uniref:Helix-turn-helix domain-containing protein n=2 Tax=Azospirillum argentinense TaxID=2970906 RepID=A0A4D8PST8_9PROT|nr:helix-turn-helix domain-containing protein [Azospirillum argentinense]